ncbi:MAG TPA: hypothetical protein VGD63_11005 [Steroidobacteraceae bacterium]
MKTASMISIALAALGGSMAANAQTYITSGTSEFLSARNCIAGATACDSIGKVLNVTEGGLPGQTSSSVTQTIPGYGSTSASAQLTGVLGSPILNVSAMSTAGTREGATAYALQSYTYTGTTSVVDTFGGSVSYSQTITGNYPSGTPGTYASIEVFALPQGTLFNAGSSSDDNYYAMAAAGNNNSATSGNPQLNYTLLAESPNGGVADSSTNLNGMGSTSVNVKLDPGETVWVLASLGAYAPNGSSIDPTFTTKWTSSANLVTGIAAPEMDSQSAASGLTLLLGGILVLRGRSRFSPTGVR